MGSKRGLTPSPAGQGARAERQPVASHAKGESPIANNTQAQAANGLHVQDEGQSSSSSSSSASGNTDALTVFTSLWAQVMILQVVKLAPSITLGKLADVKLSELSWPALLATACLMAMLMPHAGGATAYLMVASLTVLWFTGAQSNHVFMDMAICIAVLMSFSTNRAKWLTRTISSMRAFLVALYSITALHKMNADWEDPKYSCSSLMLAGVFALAPLRPLLSFVPIELAPRYATVTEVMLPLLVSLGICDRLTIILGSVFHAVICQMLSPMSVYPFSMLMAPTYVFLIPDRAPAMFDRMKPWAALIVATYAVVCRVWTPLMVGDFGGSQETLFEYPAYGCWAPGVVWCNFAYASLVVAAVWPSPARPVALVSAHPVAEPLKTPLAKVSDARRSGISLLPAFATLLFGLAPYFGVRNYPALAMFSNLRTEGGRSNHNFMQDDLDVLGWQRDFVTVHETNISSLWLAQVDLAPLFTPATRAALATAGVKAEFWITPPSQAWPYAPTRSFQPYSMPFLELRRRVAALRQGPGPVGFVRYTRTKARAQLAMPWLWAWLGVRNRDADLIHANITYSLTRGGDTELEEPLPRWQASLARFRVFDVAYSPCRH
mmetsp:Transcript_1036/g.1935  ORF Transcript_1036/g.1935 Transcript_1036/m.1935 type:complete len:607 (-) Transcript_1036:91-1911(-)